VFVALSKFTVANDMAPAVKEAFRHRPHLVESAQGFVRLDVLSPEENPNELWLLTYWTRREDFQQWHRSHLYHECHRSLPKGLRLVAKSTSLSSFEYVTS
jgi:heme-degrading monooxygenase HmoA